MIFHFISFQQREFPKFFTFRARDGVIVWIQLISQHAVNTSEEMMTLCLSMPLLSSRRIGFTGIWSQL